MKLFLKKNTSSKVNGRLKKKLRIRKKVHGSAERPRLCIFKSAKHIYASLIDDVSGKTLMSVSSLSVEDKLNGVDMAKKVGVELAKKALNEKVDAVVFDRNGFIYHGRVKSLADGAREGGLNF
jgi:large subunit ribosomal protein L18